MAANIGNSRTYRTCCPEEPVRTCTHTHTHTHAYAILLYTLCETKCHLVCPSLSLRCVVVVVVVVVGGRVGVIRNGRCCSYTLVVPFHFDRSGAHWTQWSWKIGTLHGNLVGRGGARCVGLVEEPPPLGYQGRPPPHVVEIDALGLTTSRAYVFTLLYTDVVAHIGGMHLPRYHLVHGRLGHEIRWHRYLSS
jgi:hypothetical protein